MGKNVLEQILEGSMKPRDLPLKTLRKITNNFSKDRVIGGGLFGTVYKGVLRNGNNVAVKRIVSSMTIDEKLFHREVGSLMEVNHQNIVRFFGFCSHTVETSVENPVTKRCVLAEKRERLLCFEYMSNGSLDKYITDELRGLDWDRRFQIAKGICMGLSYLHMEKGILHMDLKPANILLDNQMVPKITDFGLSRPADKSQTTSSNHFFTLGYTALENTSPRGRKSVSSDIYSLGAIIMELVTGHKGVPGNNNNVLRRWRHRWNKSAQKMQQTYQRQVTKCIEIGQLCKDVDPVKRPSISNIVNEFIGMESMDKHVKNIDSSIFGQINPPFLDDDMLGVEPLELRFANLEHSNKNILSCSVELSNDTCGFIAFDIRTTSPLPYSIEPDIGIVVPQSKFIVTITMHNDMLALQNSIKQYTENFIMRSTKVDEGLTTKDINQGIFDTSMVDEVSLTVVSDNQLAVSCVTEEPKEVLQDPTARKEDLPLLAKGLKTLGKNFQGVKLNSGEGEPSLNPFPNPLTQSPYMEAPSFGGTYSPFNFPMPSAPPPAQRDPRFGESYSPFNFPMPSAPQPAQRDPSFGESYSPFNFPMPPAPPGAQRDPVP